jgi:hypothetical protein
MPILLPSTVTRALEALGAVMGTSDVHEYLDEEGAAAVETARRVLCGLRATAIQVCDDPAHEIEQVRRGLVRLVELSRARQVGRADP